MSDTITTYELVVVKPRVFAKDIVYFVNQTAIAHKQFNTEMIQ